MSICQTMVQLTHLLWKKRAGNPQLCKGIVGTAETVTCWIVVIQTVVILIIITIMMIKLTIILVILINKSLHRTLLLLSLYLLTLWNIISISKSNLKSLIHLIILIGRSSLILSLNVNSCSMPSQMSTTIIIKKSAS